MLDRPGMARALSLPSTADRFASPYLTSYRTQQGVLHNPKRSPHHPGRLPRGRGRAAGPRGQAGGAAAAPSPAPGRGGRGASGGAHAPALHRQPARAGRDLVSLLLRPLVCPAGAGISPEKRMEVRFFAPGSLVSNLDFVESIFGNAGDPYLPENDAALDVDGWTGHTGCVILAPHLVGLRARRTSACPTSSQATAAAAARRACAGRERRRAATTTASPSRSRPATAPGVMVTIIADNYFGYCKKEVKTQIGYAANLFGLAEEEHAGGALAFPTFRPGRRLLADAGADRERETTASRRRSRCSAIAPRCSPSGYATDRTLSRDPLHARRTWRSTSAGRTSPGPAGARAQHLKLLPDHDLHLTRAATRSGMAKHRAAPSWRLIGTRPGGRVLPQALHRLGRRQVGDPQEPGRRRAAAARSTCGASTRTWQVVAIVKRDFDDASAGAARRTRAPAPAPLARALARLGDQAAHAHSRRVHAASTTPGSRAIPQPRPRAGVRDQALLPAGVGRRLAAPLQRRHHQRPPGHELKYEGRRLVANYLRIGRERERRLADVQAAAGLHRGRQGADGGRHHRLGGRLRAPAGRPAGRVRRPSEPQAGAELRVPAVPAARRRDPPRASIARPRRTWPAPGSSAPTSSRSPRRTRSGLVEDVALHDAFTAPMRAHVARNAARAGGRLLDLLGPAAAHRRQAHQEPALPAACGRTWRIRATATWRRWARGSTAGCRCTRRCSSR